MSNLVKRTTFIMDPIASEALSEIRTKVLGDVRPTATTLCVSRPLGEELLVEIDALGVR